MYYMAIVLIGYGAGSELPSNLIILTDILDTDDQSYAIVLNLFCPLFGIFVTCV